MKPLIAIVGPTAVGKSKLALFLAQNFDGEIVNADSYQVYRFMDIGTAKPSLEERALVPYHLIDIVAPDEPFSLALYQELAYKAIEDIRQRGRLPLLVGGSGLYVWAVLEGWKIPQVAPDGELRRKLEQRAAAEGSLALYRELQEIDPAAAMRIDPRNVRRVIRALEVCRVAGVPFSGLQQKSPPPFPVMTLGLTASREDLYRRIDARVDDMVKKGLVEEVRSLMGKGYGLDLSAMSGIGYRQIGGCLQGKLALPEAVQQIKFETHRLARHQYAWFRPSDPRLQWFDIREELGEAVVRWVRSAIDR